MNIPVEISARHVHLSVDDLEKLFGEGYELKKARDLTQFSDFCAEESVDIKNGEKTIKNVRIVGPLRVRTQVELSKTDAINLGVNPPIRLSGDIDGTPGVTLVGPQGEVEIAEGLIIAQRHIHCSQDEAKKIGLEDGGKVSVKIESDRPIIFENVPVRIKKDYKLCLHLDTDEGNAAGINRIGEGQII
jgi:propanediol utilization protein